MSSMGLYIIYAGVFVSILLAIEGIYLFAQDQFGLRRHVNRRMRTISRTSDRRAALSLLKNEKAEGLAGLIANLLPALSRLIWIAGLVLPTSRLLMLCGATGVVALLIFRVGFKLPLAASFALGVGLAFVIPILTLLIMAQKRQKKLSLQLPGAVDLMVRGLEAGHPVSPAMGLVAQEMPDPIGTEFGIAIDEMTYGLSMDVALSNMIRRFPNADLKFLTMSIQIQRETGGNLVEILGRLSETIRSRFAMYGKIRAVSAEGRFSGLFVGAMPFIIGGAILVLKPDHFGAVSSDPLFLPILGTAAGLLVVGGLFIWRLVQIRI